MESSILVSVKKNIGVSEESTVFDHDILTFINTAFSTLNELGVGPLEGFFIEDDTVEWDEFTEDVSMINSVKTYVYLRVRLLFDPPGTSFGIDAFQKQIDELAWRMNVRREGTEWVDPLPPVLVQDE